MHKTKSTPPQSAASVIARGMWAILFLWLVSLISPTELRAQDSVMLSPASGNVGTEVTLSGKKLGARFVSIYWDEQILDTKVPIKNEGELNYKFKVPPSVRGKHTVAVREFGASSSTNLASAVFIVVPHVEIFPDIGRPHMPVTITGRGFAPSEKDIKILWDSTMLLASVQANQFGSWGVTVEVPEAAKGEHFIAVSGTTTSAGEVGTMKFTIAPFAKITPISGPVGTEVKIQGVGFRTGEDGITITYDNEIIKCNIVGGPDGSWDTSITIPPSTVGYHIIGVYGSSFTPKGIVPDTQFMVVPRIELEPNSGAKGDKVTIKGSGFAASEKVTITFDSTVIDTVTADSLGSFRCVFQTPQAQKGGHSITASGSSGNIAKASFTVERTTPLPPVLLYPKNKEKLEIFSSIGKLVSSTSVFLLHAIASKNEVLAQGSVIPEISLSWANTAADEDITYTLQISRGWDENPVMPILVEEHLNETNYKCSLPPGHYSWRVKAVDDIGNESPWSDAGQFQTVMFSPLVLATLIAILLFAVGMAIWVWFSIAKT